MNHVSASALPGRILGSSLEVSPIGLGCMGMSGTYGASDDSEAVATIHAVIDHGVTLLDTSDMYGAGHNEVLVGRAIRGHRQQVVVATPSTLRGAHLVHPVSALQSEYSLWWRGVEADILPTCAEPGVGFVAYSPLGRGLLTGALRVPADLPREDRRRQHPRFQAEHLARNVALVDAIAEVAAGIGCSTAQLAVAWLLAQGNHVVAIPGVKRRTHLLASLAVLSMTLNGDIFDCLDAVAPVDAGSGLRYPENAMKGIEL